MKRNIIAIGGGRIMVPAHREPQTLSIDQAIVRRSKKKQPNLLFIPTASEDDLEYCQAIENLYGGRLGCGVEHLLLFKDRPSKKEIKEKILSADIIYVGGGNTLRMMKLWRRLGVDVLLNSARKRGTVLCGLSAGAICWFRQGNSDSKKFSNDGDPSLLRVKGLNYADLLLCPHYDTEKHRQPGLKSMMKKTRGVAIALENCTAIEISNDGYRILTSNKRKNAWRIYWGKGIYFKEKLSKEEKFRDLQNLLTI